MKRGLDLYLLGAYDVAGKDGPPLLVCTFRRSPRRGAREPVGLEGVGLLQGVKVGRLVEPQVRHHPRGDARKDSHDRSTHSLYHTPGICINNCRNSGEGRGGQERQDKVKEFMKSAKSHTYQPRNPRSPSRRSMVRSELASTCCPMISRILWPCAACCTDDLQPRARILSHRNGRSRCISSALDREGRVSSLSYKQKTPS